MSTTSDSVINKTALNHSASKRKPLSGAAAYRRLLRYTYGYKKFFVIAVSGMLVYAFAEMQVANFIQVLVDEAFVGDDKVAIIEILWVFTLILLGRSGGTLLAQYYMSWVSRGVIRSLRADMFQKLLRLPNSFYDNISSGEIIASFSYNVEQIAESNASAITTLIQDTCLLIFLVGYMFSTNAKLSLVLLVIAPLFAIIVYAVSFQFRKISRRIQQSIGKVTHVVNETVDGYQVVKIFAGEAAEQRNFERANQRNFQQNLKLSLIKSGSTALVQLIAGVGLISVIVLATSGIVGEVTPGMFSAFIVAMVRMSPPLKHMMGINVQLQRGIAAAQSIFAMLDELEEQDSGRVPLTDVRGEIEYRHVGFAYAADKGAVLNQVSFTIQPGQTIALVGRSGSGKSTIAKLLPRFYEVSAGQILLDGHNIKDYPLASLREQIAFVDQNVTLFNDTIANNIAYGALSDTSRDAIIAAAEAANAMDFIQQLPDGLDTVVGEDGVLLSGGQRQRLAIARALLKNSPILVLDEATSALDSESEQHIQAALDKLLQGRTTIVIAHRLSTIENADQIIVMDNGQIAEMGSHQDLLAQNGQYASLHKLQFHTGSSPQPKTRPGSSTSDAINNLALQNYRPNFLDDQSDASLWERLWYGDHPLKLLLTPLLAVVAYGFGALVSLRRQLYQLGILPSQRFPVPVIVVGNITVGGTGKTPLVIWLANHLRSLGYKPGIISRGYKGRATQWPLTVSADSNPAFVGDEAALIVRRTASPMVVDPNRCQAIERLLADNTDCDIVIADDGLQHYALQRDIEIVVTDGSRGFGNSMMLPVGPMREPKTRLRSVDYVITNGVVLPNAYPMSVSGKTLINLGNAEQQSPLSDWQGRQVHALAAIGNPERFFTLLRGVGMQVIEHRFMDHHAFTLSDLQFDRDWPVVMTEKDAVKCAEYIQQLDPERFWYLPVDAILSDEFIAQFDQQINTLVTQRNERRTA